MRLKDTDYDAVAVYSFTGIDTKPNEIVPVPIARAAMRES